MKRKVSLALVLTLVLLALGAVAYAVVSRYSVADAEVNDTIEYVTLGSVLFYAKVTDVAATTKNVAMVISGENTGASGTSASSVKAKLLLGL